MAAVVGAGRATGPPPGSMLRRRRALAIPAGLWVGAFALAFAQRPGLQTADTKINLHVDPVRFLSDAASMWSSSGQLGDVQAGQQAGYLFPMAPFFAAGHALGLSDWVVQRLWLGTLLALAAWGAVRLLDALLSPRRGVAHLTAGAVIVLNPFVVTYVNRTTVTLLAYAALPWLLLAVHRGLREPRGWRWPAALALLVTASGGGINGAVTAWMLLGPALLLLYEPLFGGAAWSQVRAFLLRALPLTLLACLWWVIPAYLQSSYGIDFLHFTEQPGTIWGTTSVTESLRLMSFWLSYVGIGFAGRSIPYFDTSATLLFSPLVVLASLLLPAATLTGFAWTRRWSHGPFLLGLALVAVVIMVAGFPEGTPLRHGLTFTYNHVAAVRFLRASYKAAPLLAIALAGLAGAASREGWERLRVSRRPRAWPAAAALGGAGILVAAAWPLISGQAQDAQVSFPRVPAAWRAAARDLDRELPANSRAVVLPGELFAFYTWGGTVDPILPALSRRPVAQRSEVPYADLRATDLLWTIDSLVHQQRLLPGQLAPLLGLIGARSVVSGTDGDPARSDAPAPADVARELAAQPGFALPARSYGAASVFAASGLGPPARLPEVRRYDLPSARGLVRVQPQADPLVLDGSAGGLAELAAFGQLPAHRAILYAADLAPARLRAAVAGGGQVVISDSNRRRAFVASSLEQNTGPVLATDQAVSADGIMLDPFGHGSDFETVASFTGVRATLAPGSPQRAQFPEHRPFAALDGSAQTAWLADPALTPDRRWLEVDLSRTTDVPYLDLLPYDDAGGSVRAVQIAGRTYIVHPGWNRLPVGLRRARSVRITLSRVSPPARGAAAGAGGISELRIPGVRPGERLRLPVDAARALRGQDLRRVALTYLFERTTGDAPYQRDLAHGPFSAFDVHQPGDAELFMRRVFELPVRRTFRATAWVRPFSSAPDAALDRLAGYRGPVTATSSSRFDGQPRWRASSALDGDPHTAWIGDWDPSHLAWLQWRSPRFRTLRGLRLVPAALPVRRPTRIRILWPGGFTPPLAVSSAGLVSLPAPVRARRFTIEVLGAAPTPGASAAQRRAVGIAEVRAGAGGPRLTVPLARRFRAPCGSISLGVGTTTVALSADGSAAAFGQGLPLAARACGTPVTLGAGAQPVIVHPGPLAVDELSLASAAAVARPATGSSPATGAGGAGAAVLVPGTRGRGSYDHVRLAVGIPSWLVLGESYNRGWRAWCNGRALGAPVPIDGYANGWAVKPGCRQVRFAFAPNRVAAVGYLVSGLAGLGCLAILAGAGWRRRRAPETEPLRLKAAAGRAAAPTSPGFDDPPARWRPPRAGLTAVVAGAGFGFVFGLPAGVASVPVIALGLWRGLDAPVLTLTAGVLLGVVVPVLYLLHPEDARLGNHFSYAMDHLAAHWVGVAALGLLTGALWRTLARARATRTGRAGRPPGAWPRG